MNDATDVKLCLVCGTRKPLDQFGRDRHRPDGLNPRCKLCRAKEHLAYSQTPAGKASAKRRRDRWNAANPEKARAAAAAWHAKNPDYSAEANKRWRAANPGAAAAYHQANREKAIERVQRRRNRLKATSGPVDLAALWDSCEGICGLCGDVIDADLAHPDPMSKSVDHIVPLSKGGTHEQSNLQWAHLVCNIRKGATVPD